MNKEEFLSKYLIQKVKFEGYYKYTFYFVGKAESGEEITIWIGGDTESIYRLDIDADETYTINHFVGDIVNATVETTEEVIDVRSFENE